MERNFKDNPELEKLISQISSLPKPKIDSDKANELKAHLLAQISQPEEERIPFGYRKLVEYLRNSSGYVDTTLKAKIKEHVFERIEESTPKSFFWRNFFAFNKKILSASLIVMLMVGLFSFIRVDISVVRAQSFTILDSFSGEVTIERNGEFVEIYSGMEIFEEDRIVTSEGSATIMFFDNSVGRISAHSEVTVDKLLDDQQNLSQVEISLQEGAFWSKVLNLITDDSSFVVKSGDVYVSTQKGAFNTENAENKIEVEVFGSSVQVKGNDQEKTVLKGQKAVYAQEVTVVMLDEQDREQPWIKNNLESDKQYVLKAEDRLLAARLESLGITLEEADLSPDSSLGEKLGALTFDGVSQKKNDLEFADKNFAEAQVKLLSDKDLTPEEKAALNEVVKKFEEEVKSFYKFAEEVKATDQEYGEELKNYAESKILSYKKDFSMVLPNSSLYGMKEVVANLELLTATSQEELISVKKNQAGEKLQEVEEISALGETQLANQSLQKYKENLSDVVALAEDSTEVGSAVKEEIVKQAENDLEILAATPGTSRDDVTQITADVNMLKQKFNVPGKSGEVVTTTEPIFPAATISVEENESVSLVENSVAPQITKEETVESATIESAPTYKYGIKIEGDKAMSPLLEF